MNFKQKQGKSKDGVVSSALYGIVATRVCPSMPFKRAVSILWISKWCKNNSSALYVGFVSPSRSKAVSSKTCIYAMEVNLILHFLELSLSLEEAHLYPPPKKANLPDGRRAGERKHELMEGTSWLLHVATSARNNTAHKWSVWSEHYTVSHPKNLFRSY